MFATACFLLWSGLGIAQKPVDTPPDIKFGKITPDQFASKSADSTAEAVVLYQYGESYFDVNVSDLWIVCQYHVRLQIRKKSAYDRAIIQLPVRRGLAGQHEHISAFDGYTFNLTDGNVTTDRLNKAGHFTEKVSEQVFVEKYTFPNIREGSIIDYQYTTRTPFNVSHNPQTWRFQQDIPVNWSEYRVAIPDFFYYQIVQSGYFDVMANEYKSSSLVTYRFAAKDVPAFKNEVYSTTAEDYLAKVDFELASYQLPGGMLHNFLVGWPAFDKTLLDDASFGGQIKHASFLRDKAKLLLTEHADTLGRIRAAYDFIRHTVKWNNESAIWSRNIKKVLDDKKGDAADINLLLIALLREMNIDANPVILSTRSHGRMDDNYPLIKKFNYVVAHVWLGGKDVLLDATDDLLVPGMLPIHCLNGKGRLIHPTKARFISLYPSERDIEVYTGAFTLNANGEVTGKLNRSQGGYSGWSARRKFASEGKAKYLESIQKNRPSWLIEQADFAKTDVKTSAFNVVYTIAVPEACTKTEDRLYFRPMLTEAHMANPFKELKRLYPVDFAVPIEETFTATYTLPTGFQVEEMPKPISMALPNDGGRFLYQVSTNAENQLQVISRIQLRRSVYLAEEYETLRELFSQIVAKHAEQVVLKRGTIADKK
ncbi:hypothetical protein GCM10028810_69170 [Spirosoma litoris]